MTTDALTIRCAVYTRKSTDEGLEQDFNSLDAQREAAEAYIASQKHDGWVVLPVHYDVGFSGGNTDRPAFQRLMADVEVGKVDCIVVYKIDRLSAVVDGLRPHHGGPRASRCQPRQRHPAVQHHHVHGPPDTERPSLLRPV